MNGEPVTTPPRPPTTGVMAAGGLLWKVLMGVGVLMGVLNLGGDVGSIRYRRSPEPPPVELLDAFYPATSEEERVVLKAFLDGQNAMFSRAYPEAIGHMTTVLERRPDMELIRFTRGITLLHLGRRAEGRQDLEMVQATTADFQLRRRAMRELSDDAVVTLLPSIMVVGAFVLAVFLLADLVGVLEEVLRAHAMLRAVLITLLLAHYAAWFFLLLH
jgi:hypothetical protein